jgi:uncharacterized protein YsxB (DUF464 family)
MAVRILNNRRGSSVIELSQCIVLIVTGISAILFYLVFWFSKFWLNQTLYEGLVCLADKNSEYICKEISKDKINKVLKWGEVEEIFLSQINHEYKGYIQWKIKKKYIFIKKKILKKEFQKTIRDF